MDVQGSQYHLLHGAADWGGCIDAARSRRDLCATRWASRPTEPLDGAGTAWEYDDDARAGSGCAATPRCSAGPGAATPLDPARRRGAGRDGYGNWYWIDADRRTIRWLPAARARPRRRGGRWTTCDRACTCRDRAAAGVGFAQRRHLPGRSTPCSPGWRHHAPLPARRLRRRPGETGLLRLRPAGRRRAAAAALAGRRAVRPAGTSPTPPTAARWCSTRDAQPLLAARRAPPAARRRAEPGPAPSRRRRQRSAGRPARARPPPVPLATPTASRCTRSASSPGPDGACWSWTPTRPSATRVLYCFDGDDAALDTSLRGRRRGHRPGRPGPTPRLRYSLLGHDFVYLVGPPATGPLAAADALRRRRRGRPGRRLHPRPGDRRAATPGTTSCRCAAGPAGRWSASGEGAWYDFGERWIPLQVFTECRFASDGHAWSPPAADVGDARPGETVRQPTPGLRLAPAAARRPRARPAPPIDDPGPGRRRPSPAGARAVARPAGAVPALRRLRAAVGRPVGRPARRRRATGPLPAGMGTYELLFQQVVGRYLQLEITLTGGGRSSAACSARCGPGSRGSPTSSTTCRGLRRARPPGPVPRAVPGQPRGPAHRARGADRAQPPAPRRPDRAGRRPAVAGRLVRARARPAVGRRRGAAS